MRILLLGEYSNVHHNLSVGLKQLGHDVTVASDGDGWKNYERDIDLKRKGTGKLSTLRYLFEVHKRFAQFKDYDVVQIINPVFLSLKAERMWYYYRKLRQNNRSVFMGAFGMDHYYVKACLDTSTFRYSDFNLGEEIRQSTDNDIWIADWLKGEKGRLNQYVAKDCDGIIAGLYEYYVSYAKEFSDKLIYVPFPIECSKEEHNNILHNIDGPIRFFIGIQKTRNKYKGTDVMLRALERVKADYPTQCEVVKVESVPFHQYMELMQGSHVILDQLYSYTPAMNALEAMKLGLIVVGGGEPDYYDFIGDNQLRPVVNVEPNEESVYQALKQLVLHPEMVEDLSVKSRQFISYYHDCKKVAQQYLAFWESKKTNKS